MYEVVSHTNFDGGILASDRSEETGVSCVFVTHNLYHAFQVCDRFVVMAHGSTVKSVAKEDTSLNELTDLIMTH